MLGEGAIYPAVQHTIFLASTVKHPSTVFPAKHPANITVNIMQENLRGLTTFINPTAFRVTYYSILKDKKLSGKKGSTISEGPLKYYPLSVKLFRYHSAQN